MQYNLGTKCVHSFSVFIFYFLHLVTVKFIVLERIWTLSAKSIVAVNFAQVHVSKRDAH